MFHFQAANGEQNHYDGERSLPGPEGAGETVSNVVVLQLSLFKHIYACKHKMCQKAHVHFHIGEWTDELTLLCTTLHLRFC